MALLSKVAYKLIIICATYGEKCADGHIRLSATSLSHLLHLDTPLRRPFNCSYHYSSMRSGF
ncbi:MAG: hypothetical protein QFX38_07410 [Methanothermobacter sp.]|nr:hypothetical protein [Methanothermobacter sp.]